MIDEAVGGVVERVVAAFSSVVDDLYALCLTSLPGRDLLELSQLIERQLRRLAWFDHTLVAALVSSDAYLAVGARSTASLLVHALRVSPGEASVRVRAARELGPRVDYTGGAMEPQFPAVARAQADGVISASHARVVTSTVRDLPATVRAAHGEALAEFLVDQAREHAPDFLTRAAKHAVAVLDPDGTLASDEDHHRRRGLSITPLPDGSSDLRGRLTPECTAVLQAVLDPLAKPASAAAASSDTTTGCAAGDTAGGSTAAATSAGNAAAEAMADPRSYAQRMHDALLDAGQRLLRSDTLPDSGGLPATVLVTMTLDQLETRLGVATTSHGGPRTVPAALRLAADADVIPVVLADGGGILAHGRTERHATKHQRRALAARDGGCSFPGCDAPPQWCQAHHVLAWELGGPTDLDNLTLVCGYHHREHQRQGWECQLTNGVPEWLPPWWIDADRTPQHNHTHHITRFALPHAA